SLFFLSSLALGITQASCHGMVALGGPTDGANGTPGPTTVGGTQTLASKVDLLLMIDNSTSMGDKQDLLKQSVPDLVARLLNPNCIDAATGTVYGASNEGTCAQGKAEFAPVKDLHVGIISSSLGGRGGDVCADDEAVPLGAVSHDDDHAHLLVRTSIPGGGEQDLPPGEAPDGVLAFGPGGITDSKRFLDDLTLLVSGVGEHGCGLEAQLEAWYRFL